MKLRALQPNEYQAVCARAIGEQWPGLVKGTVLTSDDFPRILELPGHSSYAMGDGDTPAIGFGQVWQSPNGKTNLIRILVDPARRGKGLGKQLCALLLAEALAKPGVQQVSLRVRRDNLPAVAVYRSLGFHDGQDTGNPEVLAMEYSV